MLKKEIYRYLKNEDTENNYPKARNSATPPSEYIKIFEGGTI